jgi:hypothetical protein
LSTYIVIKSSRLERKRRKLVPVPKSVKKWTFFETIDHVFSSLSGSPDKGSNVFVSAELKAEQRANQRVFFGCNKRREPNNSNVEQ